MTQVIDLGKLRFHFAGNWSNSTTYEQNDVVKYGGNVYVYYYNLKTSGNKPTDTTYWKLMVEGFSFDGIWDSASSYNVGDGVSYGGKVFVAQKASTNKNPGLPVNDSLWSTFVDGIQWEGDYDNTTDYQASDVVSYGGSAYIAKQNTTGNDPENSTYWDQFITGIGHEGVYNNSTAYKKDDTVAYGGNIYRAKQASTGNVPTNTTYWEKYVGGTDFRDSFDSATEYFPNDLVNFGGDLYRALDGVTGTDPNDSAEWKLIVEGLGFTGDWSSSRGYYKGDVVKYGGSLFKAITNSTNVNPTTTANWKKLVPGFSFRQDWDSSVAYGIDEVVNHGGNSYISLQPHTSTSNFDSDLANSNWEKFNSGIRVKGNYTTGASYITDDLVNANSNVYIVKKDMTASGNFASDLADSLFEIFIEGGANVLPTIDSADIGKVLTVNSTASGYTFSYPDDTKNTFYVSADEGTDDSNLGISQAAPFKTINFAMKYVDKNIDIDSNATVLLSQGVYKEDLPIHIPHNTTMIGAGLRNTKVIPNPGYDSAEAMFMMRNATLVEGITMSGMTGFQPDSDDDQDPEADSAVYKGVFFKLDPNYAISTKSPYIKDCSAFSTGGIGALVDGGHFDAARQADSTTNGSMVFHAFTNIHSDGIGFWIRNNGKAEIVSCFTYYCHMGYVASSGGKIRALNGNNSYGKYGSVGVGFDSNETSVDGTVRGFAIDYKEGSLEGGEFEKGDVIRQPNRDIAISKISRSNPGRVTTPVAHLLDSNDRIRLKALDTNNWDSDLGNDDGIADGQEYHIKKVDSFKFDLFTDSAFTSTVDTRFSGGKEVSSVNITDITRSNPIAVTVSSHNFDSFNLVQVKNVVGMTQVNDKFFLVDSHDANILKLKEAENNYWDVGGDSNGFTLSGTGVGTAYDITGDSGFQLYRGSRYYFRLDSSTGYNPFYLTTNDSNSWSAGNYSGEVTTGVTNSRVTYDSDKLYKITIDSAQPGPLYVASGKSGTSGFFQEITLVDPPRVDATSFSAYSTGGSMTFTDSGDDFDSGTAVYQGTKGTILNVQTSIDRIIVANQFDGSGFKNGDSIQESGGGGVFAILADSDAAHGQYGFTMTFEGFDSQPLEGGSVQFVTDSNLPTDSGYDSFTYVIQSTTDWDSTTGRITLVFAQRKEEERPAFHGQTVRIRYNYSQVRLTGHDFLDIGTGSQTNTNYPNNPLSGYAPTQGNEIIEKNTGRVYYVSTDQDGNFRVGNYFRIDQATGRATLDASAFDLAGLTSLRLGSIGAKLGETINEFSSDTAMSGASNSAVPTEFAVKTYVDNEIFKNRTKTIPPTAKTGEIAFEQYIGFDAKDLTTKSNYRGTRNGNR